MNPRRPERGILILIAMLTALSSAAFLLETGPIFLPLVVQQVPTSTPTPTLTPTPSGTPMPPTIQLTVTPANPDKDWALAWFAKSYNQAGRPIMEIYPGDSKPESERIKIPEGTIVLALEKPVTADGGGKFWQLVEYKGKNGEDLFLKAEDVTKVTP